MVQLAVVEQANRALAAAGTRPYVAVFVGGTAGIGSYAAQALAKTHGAVKNSRGLRIYIVGRNQAAAEQVIANCRKSYPKGTFVFVQATDLGLLRNVDAVCADITKQETAQAAVEGHAPQIDLAVLTQGVLNFGARNDTSEGLDHTMSLLFYSRARVIDRLLPLLTADAESPGHVVHVANPKLEKALCVDDLDLRDPRNFSGFVRIGQSAALATFYAEALASRHRGRLAITHYYPGYVVTSLATSSPLPGWAKVVWRWVVSPIMGLFKVPEAECGARVIFLGDVKHYPPQGVASAAAIAGANGQAGTGAYRSNWNNDAFPPNKLATPLRAAGAADKVYAHAQTVFAAVAEKGAYKTA